MIHRFVIDVEAGAERSRFFVEQPETRSGVRFMRIEPAV